MLSRVPITWEKGRTSPASGCNGPGAARLPGDGNYGQLIDRQTKPLPGQLMLLFQEDGYLLSILQPRIQCLIAISSPEVGWRVGNLPADAGLYF
jgi:hypothetical protein